MIWRWPHIRGRAFGPSRHDLPKRRRYGLIGAQAFVAILVLLGPSLRPVPSIGNLSEDRGYPAFVRELAEQGLLEMTERADAPAPRSLPGRVSFDDARIADLVARHAAGRGSIGACHRRPAFYDLWGKWFGDVPGPDDCKKLLREFRSDTFLREDMRIDSSLLWERDEGRLVGLAPGAHAVGNARGAFAAWRGEVSFARPYSTTMLVDLATRERLVRFDPRARGDQVLSVGSTRAADSGGMVVSGLMLRDSRRDCAGNVKLSLLGDHVLLTLFPTNRISDCAPVYVDNRLIFSPADGFGGFDYQLLAPGQVLTFAARGAPLVLQVVQSLGAISAMDDRVRRFDPSLAPVGQAIALAGPLGNNFKTTIIPDIHFAAQRLLERQAMAEIPGERSSFRAAAILVDGLSGEVAAMPTFPLVAAHLVQNERSNSSRLAWLSQNQNLVPLPVGSAAKVPFATAIVQAHPDLLTLKVWRTGGGFTHLLGRPLTANGFFLKDTVSGEVDFNRFIKDSSNYYALLLMRLAAPLNPLAQNEPMLAAADRYEINGRIRARAPALPGPGQGWAASWSPLLWKIACVPPYRSGPGALGGWWTDGAGTCPRYYLDAASVSDPELLGSVAHNTPRLELENVDPQNSFADYYMSIVGQNRSTWTTAALVQAYGRIITDRPVQLRFNRNSVFSGQDPDQKERLRLLPEVWQAVSGGMRSVASEGTGRRLSRDLGERFSGVSVFAKTGTATLDYRRPGVGETQEEGHVIVVAFVRFDRKGQGPDNICSARLVAVNFENNDGGQPALQLVLSLMQEPAIARWATAPCPDGAAS